jgi:hypothetical protein
MEDTSTQSEPDDPDRQTVEADPDAGAVGGERDGNGPEEADDGAALEADAENRPTESDISEEDADLAELRERVEAEYDFDDFGPEDMIQMSAEEWDAAFDPETWITGGRLLDRVDTELKSRIARREVFGLLERVREDGEERILVYSDEGYAIVRPSGEVSGRGTVLRDVEPLVAMAAMEEYDVPEPPDDWSLPHPDAVPEGTGEFGNLMIQVVAGVQLLAGVVLLAASVVMDLSTIVAPAMGLAFLLVGVFLFAMVANARLSDRFRSEEYRDRLRALREAEERPGFVPVDGEVIEDGSDDG